MELEDLVFEEMSREELATEAEVATEVSSELKWVLDKSWVELS